MDGTIIELARGGRFSPSDLNELTASVTSKKLEAKNSNAMVLYCYINGTGTWTVKIQGKDKLGNFMDCYDNNGNLMALSSLTASACRVFVGIPDDFRIVVTEDADGSELTVSYELFSV